MDGYNSDAYKSQMERAIYIGDLQKVRDLVADDSVDLNRPDSIGASPLIWAARSGYSDIVRHLIDTGRVQINRRDQFGITALMWAVDKSRDDIVEMLIAAGADTKIKSKDGIQLAECVRALQDSDAKSAIEKLLISPA